MKSSFMREGLSTLEKQMQGGRLRVVDGITELDARNVRINYVYLRLLV